MAVTLFQFKGELLKDPDPYKTLTFVNIPIVVPSECPTKYNFSCPVLFTMKSIMLGRSYLAISSKLQNKTGSYKYSQLSLKLGAFEHIFYTYLVYISLFIQLHVGYYNFRLLHSHGLLSNNRNDG